MFNTAIMNRKAFMFLGMQGNAFLSVMSKLLAWGLTRVSGRFQLFRAILNIHITCSFHRIKESDFAHLLITGHHYMALHPNEQTNCNCEIISP